MPQTVVVVPCYNEEGRLAVDEFMGLAKNGAARLLFVNDGSRDGTESLLRSMVANSPREIGLISLSRNHGKAEAVRRGLCHALTEGAEVVAYVDADLATPVPEIERLLEERERAGADVVLGARVGLLGWDVRRSARRHYLGRVFATAASFNLGIRVYDTQCGAKVFRRTTALAVALAEPFRSRWVFDVELLGRLLIAQRHYGVDQLEFLEVPLRAWSDVPGSKLRATAMVGAAYDLMLIRRELSAWRRRAPHPAG